MSKPSQIQQAREKLTLKAFLLSFIISGRHFSAAKTFSSIASVALIVLFVRQVWLHGLTWDLMVGFASIFIVSKGFSQVIAWKYSNPNKPLVTVNNGSGEGGKKKKKMVNLDPDDNEEPED